MNIKEKCFRLLISSLRIFFILSLGFFLLYIIISYLFSGSDYLTAYLLIPVALVLLYGMVCLVITELIRLQTTESLQGQLHYTHRELSSLFIRSFLIVLVGILLSILFAASMDNHVNVKLKILFYGLDLLLTGYAIGSIIKGEKLREVNFRRIESENALLKSQLNPHFLYNTLNNIDALIWIDQEGASNAVVKLSSLMRYMTYQGNLRLVSLSDEVAHLNEYIELQKIRLQHPDAVQLTTTIQESQIMIAPMLLMPFIENIFKHTAKKEESGAIQIHLSADSRMLFLQTINPIAPSKEENASLPQQSGVGLQVVRRRLKLLYPHKHELRIDVQENRYCVSLKIFFKPL